MKLQFRTYINSINHFGLCKASFSFKGESIQKFSLVRMDKKPKESPSIEQRPWVNGRLLRLETLSF